MSKRVYLFRAAQFYKIGISSNIQKRLCQVQTGCPIKCEYIGYFPTSDPDRLEKELHLKFNGFKSYGEWFDMGDHNISILISEFSLKHVTNPFTAITQAQEVIAQAPVLKKVRESNADIQEIVLLYEELFPGKTLSDTGKGNIRKYISKFNKQSVVESLYNLSEKFDSSEIWKKLPHAARTFHLYGRHVNDNTWKSYHRLVEAIDKETANEFIKCVMVNNIDSSPETVETLQRIIINDFQEYSLSSILEVFVDEWSELFNEPSPFA